MMSSTRSGHRAVLVALVALPLACGSRAEEQEAEAVTEAVAAEVAAPAAAEAAEIGPELAAQLAGMGYLRRGGDPAAAGYSQAALDAALTGTASSFVLHDLSRDVYVRRDAARATQRFSPCSTFKFPHTLIALETGVAHGPDHPIAWDRERHPPQPFWDEVLRPRGVDWARDHTLTSAFHHSVVWYYQELAQQIGEQRMARYLDELDYGNRDTTGGIDRFWLSSSLGISADEQVAFLDKLATRRHELAPSTYDAAFRVFETEVGPGYRLFAKTGSGDGPAGKGLGWYVGIIERGDERFTFAFNLTAPFTTVLDQRVPLARAALRALGVLPPPGAGV